MNAVTSFSVIRYRPPILVPILPALQSTCTRLTERLSAAAASLTDKNLSILALGWADNFYRQILQGIAGVGKPELLNKFVLRARLFNGGKSKFLAVSADFKSAVPCNWIVCNHFVAPYLVYSNYTQKRIIVKGAK